MMWCWYFVLLISFTFFRLVIEIKAYNNITSGYVSSMTSKNSTCASVCLESQPYWKKSVIMYNDSCVDNFDVIGNVELSISFLPLLSFGCMIEMTHLQKTECLR